jgi:predicted nucleic acid-binding protein
MTTTIIEPPLTLVVDASVLVAELLRESGRARLAHPALRLILPDYTWGETRYEIPRRINLLVAQGRLLREEAQALTARCFSSVEDNITTITEAAYAPLEAEARWRIARDPRDWPTVALALALGVGIWTEDRDFLGCGVASWSTSTLTQLLSLLDAREP